MAPVDVLEAIVGVPVTLVDVLLAVQVVGIAVCSVVGAVAWRRREKRGALPLFGMLVGAVIWAVATVLASQIPDYGLSLVVNNLLYVGLALTVAAFFVFALVYTGREEYVTRGTLGLLAIHPVVLQVAIWTNPTHHLVFAERYADPGSITGVGSSLAPGFFVHMAYSYVLMVAGVGMLAVMLYRRQDLYRSQIAALLITIVVPLTSNVVSVAGLVPVDVTAAGFAVSGGAIAVAMFSFDFSDVTPVARSTVVNNIRDGVVVLDGDDRVLDINPTGRRMLAVEEEPVIGEHAERLLADYPELWEYFGDTEEGKEVVEVETGRGRRSFDVRVSPLLDGKDREVGRMFLIHDVTEQQRREHELERQNEQLEQFASLVSHDLRNPLNVADGYVQGIIDADDPETMKDFAREVRYSHDRMESLIEDVLTLAREGQTVDEFEPVSFRTVARDAWRNVDTAGATLHVDTDWWILADPGRLQRVLENLFRNSVEHSSTGSRTPSDDSVERGPDVTVLVGQIGEHDPGSLLDSGRRGFFVADDGPGIPPDRRDRVFEDGYTTADDGTGLGLSIVSSIVEASGWSIEVTESEDGGARFEVTGVALAEAGEDAAPVEPAPGSVDRDAGD